MATERRIRSFKNDRPGVVLLLSLILLAAVTASVIGLSLVINQTLRQSRNLDNFVVASLAADSGIERGLATIYQGRLHNIWFKWVTGAVPATETFANGAVYTNTQQYSAAPLIIPKLKSGATFSFDLLKPTSELEQEQPTDHVLIKAECAETCEALLEVNWVLINNKGESAQSNRRVLSGTSALPYVSGVNIDLTEVRNDISEDPLPFSGGYFGYRLKLRALNGDIQNISITPCDSAELENGDCPDDYIKNIVGRITIDSIGEAGGGVTVRSSKTAAILWQPPASEMLNYVLFSESDIVP